MSQPIRIAVLCGSLRTGSINAAIVRGLPELAPPGVEFAPLPPVDLLPHYNSDLHQGGFPPVVLRLAHAIHEADAVLIVTPEYNYSIPGTLKNALDWLSRLPDRPFFEKPVAMHVSSVSLLGGVRVLPHLRQVFVYLESFVFNRPEIIITKAHEKVAIDPGTITDEATRDLVRLHLEGFRRHIRRVRAGAGVA